MLVKKYAAHKVQTGIIALGQWMVRNSVQLFLAHPKTYVANVLTNDMFSLEAAFRYAVSGSVKAFTAGKGDGGRDLRLARNVLAGMVLNRFVGLREMIKFGNGTQFMRTVRETLPDQIFADSTQLADVKVRYDDKPWDLLRSGEIGGAVLAGIQYGTIDVRAKQRFAYAFLKAEAVRVAKQEGLKGKALRGAVDKLLVNPPLEWRRAAVAAANFEYLNYADSPQWLNDFSRNDFSRLLLPFPRFGYHFLAKQGQRLSALKLFLGKVPAGKRAEAFADLLTVGVFGLGGLGLVVPLVRSLIAGDDDEEDAREFIGTSVVKFVDGDGNLVTKPIDRSLITANRINLSYWARTMGLGGDGEDDFWLRVRNYPAVAMAGAVVLAENDARRFGPTQGAATYLQTVTDLGSDFFSLGAAVKVPDKLLTELRGMGSGRPERMLTDPFGGNVPLTAYVTEQVMDSFLPGVRQFDELIVWLDPVERRKTRSKLLEYDPGPWEAFKAGHLSGVIHRLFGEEELPPAGEIDRRSATVEEPREIPLSTRIAGAVGFNIKPVDRRQYSDALAE
jgi:hypothetical protein